MTRLLPATKVSTPLLHQIVAQDHGTVVKDVVGAIEQGHRAALFGVEDGPQGGLVRFQLLPVSLAKLLPALHAMVEPLPELRAGCDLLHPCVGPERLLPHTPRPQALHQDAPAVSVRGKVIRAFDPKHGVDGLQTDLAQGNFDYDIRGERGEVAALAEQPLAHVDGRQ